jgi:hypothetical protein
MSDGNVARDRDRGVPRPWRLLFGAEITQSSRTGIACSAAPPLTGLKTRHYSTESSSMSQKRGGETDRHSEIGTAKAFYHCERDANHAALAVEQWTARAT